MSASSTPHRTKKRFGQHFLIDDGVVDAMMRAIAPGRDDRLVEIGPGLGVLTQPLLERVDTMRVIEIDRDLAATLKSRLPVSGERIEIINEDVLRYDFPDPGQRVVGNLPYNISTPLLFHLFACADRVVDMHFMLQKEVVDRLVATPGSKTYGRLSVMAQYHAKMWPLFDVPPAAFDPPPKVDSSVIRLVPRALPPTAQALAGALERVVRAAFAQRRKTLRNNLAGIIEPHRIEAAGIDPGSRAETLSGEAFLRLAEVYQSNNRQ